MTPALSLGARLTHAHLDLSVPELVIALAVGVALVGVPVLWRSVRLAVTLVHELGHAFVGMLVGRRFTGFVLRGDMSGHAVTHGRASGPGLVATTWAGYPAPVALAGVLVWLVAHGWAAATLAGIFVLVLPALVRVRSLLTALVTLAVLAITAALWWWRAEVLQAQLLLVLALVLLVGGWRQLGAVLSDRSRTSDPGALGRITPLPAAPVKGSFVLVALAATWWVLLQARALLG